jgi:hypothetical protein
MAGEPPPGRWARRRSSSPDKAVADVAAAAAFRTPVATPANMMVMETGRLPVPMPDAEAQQVKAAKVCH